MAKKEKKKEKTFESDYNEIMQQGHEKNCICTEKNEWKTVGDYIRKFSLYPEIPNSITTTETCSAIN